MKKINLIEWLSRNSHEKQSPQRFFRYAAILIMLLTLGVGQMWAYNEYNKKILYIDATSCTWYTNDACHPCIDIYDEYACSTQKAYKDSPDGTTATSIWYYDLSGFYAYWEYSRGFKVQRRNTSGWYNPVQSGYVDGDTKNCFKINSESNGMSWTYYRPPMTSASVVDNGTTKTGSGTSVSPYQVVTGSTIYLSASCVSSVDDPSMTKEYKFYNKGSQLRAYSSTNTYSFKAGAAGTTYEITVTAQNTYQSGSGTASPASSKIYYTIIAEPEATNEVTIAYKCGATTIKSSTAEDVGVETPSSISAPDIVGYTFSSWSLGDGLNNESGSTTANPISITTKASGTYTLTANYNEDLTSTWHVVGTPTSVFAGASAWATDDDNMLMKPSGSSTGSAGSVTFNVKALPASESSYQFKVTNTSGDAWYGWGSEGNHYHVTRVANSLTLDGSNDLYFRPDALGEYTFSVNWSSTPTLSVPFPTAYAVNFGQGTGTSGTASATYSSTSFTSGTKVQNGKSISLSAPAAMSGKYNWDGWYNASSGGSKVSSDNPLTTTVSSSNHDFYARYTEITHTVTLGKSGNGHVEIGGATVTSVSGVGYATASGTITAVPDPGYYFTGWTGAINSGVTLASGTASSASITINATADSKTITANFAPIWRITGGNDDDSDAMGDWSTTANQITHITTSAGVMTSGYVEMTLPANTDYQFKVYDASVDKYYGKSGDVTKMEYSNRATAVTLSYNTGSNQTFRTAAAGTYRFTWTGSQVTITYPTSFKVTFGKGTGGLTITASGSTTGSISSGDYVASGEDVTFTETHTTPGYTFTGWYTTKDTGGSAVSGMSTSDLVLDDIVADATVWSRYSENMTTVNLVASPTGKGTFTCGGDAVTSVSAGVTTHPAVTAVPATGYRVNTSATVWTKDNNYVTLSSATANPVTITGTGTTDNSTALTATFTPKTYTITLNQNGATTSSSPTSLTATYDAKANGASDVFTLTNPERTGYTFRGWNTEADTSGTIIVTWAKYYEWNTAYVNNDGRWIHDGDVEVFAMWKSNEYTVTFDYEETGYGSAGSGVKTSVTATYGKAMPTMGTAPTPAPGYKFMGYFLGQNGTGVQYYDENGTGLINWTTASNTTLYAYFRKTEISSLEHPAAVAKGDVVTLDVNPVFNQTGATDYMDICWSLLYDNDNPVESGVAIERYATLEKPNQVRFTLTDLSAGYYKVKAVLKANASLFDACDAGTELSTFKSDLRIAGNSNVTILYQDASGNTIHENGSVEVARGETVDVTAPEIIGYAFDTWVLGDVLATDDALTDNPITISAEYDGHLTAKYNKKNMIYFNNTLGWDTVYVYFYSTNRYWNDTYGCGASTEQDFGDDHHKPHYRGFWGGMTKIGSSNVYYFDYEDSISISSWDTEIRGYHNVAFAKDAQGTPNGQYKNGYNWFDNTEVVRREDYYTSLSMYVPLNVVTDTKNSHDAVSTKYYNKGYWMNYPESTGYTLKIYDNTTSGALVKERDFAFPADKAMPTSITVDLEAGKTYGFKIYRKDGQEYGNNGTMTNGHSGDGSQGVWEFKSDKGRCGLTTTSAGDYTFTLSYGLDIQATPEYNYLVAVHYPEATGDFRVQYKDAVHTNWLTSVVIPKDTERDTVSYFVRTDEGKNPYIRVQKCTATYDEKRDPKTVVEWTNENSGADILPDTISEDGVYNFIFTKDNGALVLSAVEPYTGNFYIRVDGAGTSNWDNFRASDHLMPYSDYSFNQTTGDKYSHYFMEWREVTDRAHLPNVKFVVANDYSVCISDTIAQDGVANAYVDGNGYLNRDANIRFMYNYKTNVAKRAYVDGSYSSSNNFLVIESGDSKLSIRNHDDTADSIISVLKFSDNGNWLYEANVKAKPGAEYKLKSTYGVPSTSKPDENGEVVQYFKGGPGSTKADSATLIGGSGSSAYQIRLIYDFKTNRVVAAYVPSGTIEDNLEIHADIMFMREHQGDIEQITFASGKSISEIENIYCGLKFNKYTLNNKSKDAPHGVLSPLLSRYERDIFYVSFPYDVRLSDVIGFGTYGQHWIVEYYDGAARAKNGFWIDSDSYWKFVTPSMKDTFTLKAGTGYIVALDLDELYYISDEVHASIWDNTDITNLELLFPGKVSSISNVDVTYNMPSHECTINRGTTAGNRTIKDSHWNVLGVPTFKNITGQASGDPDEGVGSGEIVFANKAWVKDSLKLKFIYDGNLADNSLTPKAVKDFEFKAMHAYVVQYCGDVTFTTSATPAPASVAARTYAEEPIDVDFRLELNKDGVVEDQTFVSMTNNEDASADFEFGEDMSKEFNSNRANIYTFIGTEWVAGNTLPMTNQTTIVPVGVKIAADGEYTFSIPEGTYGVGITLIDNEAGARVNLGLMDYTVTLAAGQIDDRFVLEISPISQISTGVELLNGENGENGVRKVLIDNILYIVKDGKVFDAQGRRL